MIRGDRPTRCDIAESCCYDDQCPLWLKCVTFNPCDPPDPSDLEPVTEVVTVKDELL